MSRKEGESLLVENLHLWGNSSDRCSEERLLKRSKERYITVEVTLRNVFPCTHLAQKIYAGTVQDAQASGTSKVKLVFL